MSSSRSPRRFHSAEKLVLSWLAYSARMESDPVLGYKVQKYERTPVGSGGKPSTPGLAMPYHIAVVDRAVRELSASHALADLRLAIRYKYEVTPGDLKKTEPLTDNDRARAIGWSKSRFEIMTQQALAFIHGYSRANGLNP